MLSNQYSDTVGTGVTSPGAEEHESHEEQSVFQISRLVNEGQHNCHIEDPEVYHRNLI